MKKRISMLLALVMLVACFAFTASASDAAIYTDASNRKWSQYIVVEPTKWFKKGEALVAVTGGPNDAIDIQMLNAKHKVIWSQNKTIRCNKYDLIVKRTYEFGTNNKKYYLQFRSSQKGRSQKVDVTAKKNCRVYYG